MNCVNILKIAKTFMDLFTSPAVQDCLEGMKRQTQQDIEKLEKAA